MKKATRILMAAFVLTAFAGLVACDSDETKEEPATYETSATYAIHVLGTEIAAGQTYTHTASADELADNFVVVNFVIENKTNGTLATSHKLELIEGPSAFNGYEVCAGVTCPWDGKTYDLEPGMNPTLPIKYDIEPEILKGMSGLYKLTVGRGNGLADPQVIFFRLNL